MASSMGREPESDQGARKKLRIFLLRKQFLLPSAMAHEYNVLGSGRTAVLVVFLRIRIQYEILTIQNIKVS